MKLRVQGSGRSTKGRGPARGLLRVAAAVPLAFALLALLAPAAWAHEGTATISCKKVTYTFSDFPNKPDNLIHENVYEDGIRIAMDNYSFNGSTGGNTIPTLIMGSQYILATARWNSNGVSGSFQVSKETKGCGGIG
ncbi:MAG: hypothetical protein ACLP6E_18080 [Acidimicrobiales bacterium]